MQLSELELVRREKLARLRALGINPYPADLFPLNSNSKQITKQYKEGEKVIIAGRLMAKNIQGKASFAQLQDSEGRIQIYFNRDETNFVDFVVLDPDLFIFQYQNIMEEFNASGVEVEVFKKLGDHFTISVNYTNTQADERFSLRIPEHKANPVLKQRPAGLKSVGEVI